MLEPFETVVPDEVLWELHRCVDASQLSARATSSTVGWLEIRAGLLGAPTYAAQRVPPAVGKPTNAARDCEAKTGKSKAVERRQMRAEVVNSEPQGKRWVLPARVLRAEHGHVSEGYRLPNSYRRDAI